MRLAWLFFASTTFAASVVAGGCSTFGAADDPDAGDAGSEVAETGPAACTPSGTASKPTTCTMCAPDAHFGMTSFTAAMVVGSTFYAVVAPDATLYTASTQGTDTFTSSDQVVRGDPQNLLADDQWLYVSTSTRVSRAKLTSLKTQEQLVELTTSVNPYRAVLGPTTLYRLLPQATGTTVVVTRQKVKGGTESMTEVSLSAFALDGDTAYYAPTRATSNPPPTYLTRLDNSTMHGAPLPANPVGLAIRYPFAYVAYVVNSNTQIVRTPIDDRPDPQLVPLVTEPGIVKTFALDGDHMYWAASRGGGVNAVATADLCGGDARDIGLGVTLFGQFSFDSDYVYGGGTVNGTADPPQPVVRFPKKAK